ncbi:MAG: hypothetical protein NVS2B14_11400 [Chamaesiphon sp.]
MKELLAQWHELEPDICRKNGSDRYLVRCLNSPDGISVGKAASELDCLFIRQAIAEASMRHHLAFLSENHKDGLDAWSWFCDISGFNAIASIEAEACLNAYLQWLKANESEPCQSN